MNYKFIKKLILFIGLLIIFTNCNDDSKIEPLKYTLGEQYYRLVQVDFDGTTTIYDKEWSNNIHYIDTITGNHIIRGRVLSTIPIEINCDTEGIIIENGGNEVYFTIDDNLHDGQITVNGDSYLPDDCFPSEQTCSWYIRKSDLNGFPDFTTNNATYSWNAHIYDCKPLGILLLEFTIIERTDGTNLIRFLTTDEENSDYVAIERSKNGIDNWIELTRIPSKNNSFINQYEYIDAFIK